MSYHRVTNQNLPLVLKADAQFANTVWEALKGDHTDLRKQAIILEAHRSAIRALKGQP